MASGKGTKHTCIQFNSGEKWICIYPAYINSRKTLYEGRKIPKDKAVENPTVIEMRDVLAATGVKVVVENKLYSRERSKEPMSRGRIRVPLGDDAVAGKFSTREAVMLHIAAMIPKLKSRTGKPRVAQQPEQPPSAQSATGGSKKKGKNRK